MKYLLQIAIALLFGLAITIICRKDYSNVIIIFAGSGMKTPLSRIGREFTKKFGIEVNYSFQGTGRLGNKILSGHLPDLFIPSSMNWVRILDRKGFIEDIKPLAYHIPVIVTRKGNKAVQNISDLLRRDITIALGDPYATAIGVNCLEIFKKAGIDRKRLNVVSRAFAVKQLVRLIEKEHADAAVVWRSDAVESEELKIIEILPGINSPAMVPVCILKSKKTDVCRPCCTFNILHHLFIKIL